MTTEIKTPHSIPDWDWQYGADYRSLTSSYYISSPTSLQVVKLTSGTRIMAILCRDAATLCLPQGEMRTWFRKSISPNRVFCFRNQAGLGSANYSNTYFLVVTATLVTLARNLNDAYYAIATRPFTFNINTWYHFRVRWWNGETPETVPALAVNFYWEVDSEWVQVGATMYHTSNLWKDSAINRCGLNLATNINHYNYCDDTEIWAPAG